LKRLAYRRIVKVGNSFYVSLPRDWVKSRELEPGSLVSVEPVEDGVLIKPIESRSVKRVKARTLEGGSAQEVIRAYLAGYEVVEIRRPSPEFRRSLDRLLNLLVGLEVVEERGDHLVLQCFIREDYEVRNVLSRMDSISRSMYLDAAGALERGDEELLKLVRSRDDRLDRLYFLAVRLLRSSAQSPTLSGRERVFLIDARLVAKILEEIGDEAERLTYVKPGEGLVSAAELIAECQRRAVDSFLRGGCCEAPIDELREFISSVGEGAGAWGVLSRIARMVLDIAEIAF